MITYFKYNVYSFGWLEKRVPVASRRVRVASKRVGVASEDVPVASQQVPIGYEFMLRQAWDATHTPLIKVAIYLDKIGVMADNLPCVGCAKRIRRFLRLFLAGGNSLSQRIP
jgi:hypothetical protein